MYNILKPHLLLLPDSFIVVILVMHILYFLSVNTAAFLTEANSLGVLQWMKCKGSFEMNVLADQTLKPAETLWCKAVIYRCSVSLFKKKKAEISPFIITGSHLCLAMRCGKTCPQGEKINFLCSLPQAVLLQLNIFFLFFIVLHSEVILLTQVILFQRVK